MESASMKRALALLLTALIAGCATVERVPPATPPAKPAAAPPAAPAPAPAPAAEEPARIPRSARGKLKPIPTRALNVAADCAFKDETGYQGAMKLKVTDAQVHAFQANVHVPKRGACSFDLKDFRQTATLPNVVLHASGSRCVVRMWEQGQRVTVAFNDCQDKCSGEAYAYLWPILANARTGRCG